MNEYTMWGMLLIAVGNILTICGVHRFAIAVSVISVILTSLGVLEALR